MVINHDKKAFMRTGIPELRHPEDVDTTGDSTLREEDEEMDEDMDAASELFNTGDREDDSGDDDDNDDDKSNEKEKKNPEELGEGYEKIG